MNFEQVVMQRYATKSFDGKAIPEQKIEQLQELIRHAASSYNIQPWKIIVVKDQAMKEKIAAAAWNQPQVTTSSHLFIICADTDIEEKIAKLEKATGSKEYAAMMRSFNGRFTDEQRLAWAQKQTYLALGNAINGAKALGFDSCPMEGFDPKAVAKLLDLPANIVPTTLCPVGYASDTQPDKLRFAADEVFA